MRPIFVAETPAQLARLADAEGVEVIVHLGRDVGKSASKWAYRHLIAYRLLTSLPKPFLATFKDDHDAECPICKPVALQSQQLDQGETADLISGPRSLEIFNSPHSALKRFPAGSFWVALARASSPDVLDERRVHPERERQPMSRQGFVDSTHMQVGSSSPIQSSPPKSPSSEEADVSMNTVDEDENDARRSKPEEVTVNLISSFLEHILHVCLRQRLSEHGEVRVRVERKTSRTTVADQDVTAEDDGGICRAKPSEGYGWKVEDDFLAIIEAKKAFQRIEYSPQSGPTPVVSNEALAQYLAEAVITWKTSQMRLSRGVVLIAATSTFVRFMHFSFGSRYGDYLDAKSVKHQKGLVNQDTGENTYARMESSEWYNLQSAEGRKATMCHVLALLRWHELESSVPRVEPGLDSQDSDEFAEAMVDDID